VVRPSWSEAGSSGRHGCDGLPASRHVHSSRTAIPATGLPAASTVRIAIAVSGCNSTTSSSTRREVQASP
jgi:hypothetical protein